MRPLFFVPLVISMSALFGGGFGPAPRAEASHFTVPATTATILAERTIVLPEVVSFHSIGCRGIPPERTCEEAAFDFKAASGIAFDGSDFWVQSVQGLACAEQCVSLCRSGQAAALSKGQVADPDLCEAYNAEAAIHRLTNEGVPISASKVDTMAAAGEYSFLKGMAWDSSENVLWGYDNDEDTGHIFKIDPSSGAVSAFSVGAIPPDCCRIRGIAYDWTTDSLWVLKSGRFIFSVININKQGGLIEGSPDLRAFGFGLTFDGEHLWSAATGFPTRLLEKDMQGNIITTLELDHDQQEVDIAYDDNTFFPQCAIWNSRAVFFSHRIIQTAYEVPCGVRPEADLRIAKTASRSNVDPGEALTYTIEVTNDGPNEVRGYTITDHLPTGAAYVADDCGGALSTQGKIFRTAPLPAGSAFSCQVTVTVTDLAPAVLVNTAEVDSLHIDPKTSNNVASAAVNVAPTDLYVTKSASVEVVSPGDVLTYTVEFGNNGPGDLIVGTNASDRLPTGVTFLSTDCPGRGPRLGSLQLRVGPLSAGGPPQVCHVSVQVNEDAPDELVNTASIHLPPRARDRDPDLSNNTATVVTQVRTYQCGFQPNGLDTCILQKGDILLRRTPNLEIYGYWEHVGQYVGDGNTVDALPTGGVQFVNVDEAYGTADDWAIVRITDPVKAEVAVEFSKGMVGTGYGFLNLAQILINPFLDIRDDVSFGVYCSQLVYLGGKVAALDLDSETWSFNRAVTPDEIYLDDDVVLVDQKPGVTRSTIRVESPVDLLLVDAEARAAGTDPATGTTLSEIPGLLYSGPDAEPEYFSVENLDGPWALQLSGVGSGPFTLVIENIERGNYHTASVTGAAFPGSLTTYLIRNPGQGPAFTQVIDIDIKPGSEPNSVNLGSGGVIPVAVLSTPTFDAATVDPFSITLEGGAVQLKGKSGNAGSLEDVDGDGHLDLVIHIMDWTLVEGSTIATLTGHTLDGIPIQGSDSVRIVP